MWLGSSFLEILDFSVEQIQALYSLAVRIEKSIKEKKYPTKLETHAKQVGLLFFEPSTRTKSSFQSAAAHLRLPTINLEIENSSFQKGESLLDTLLNMQAIGVSAFVVRLKEEGTLKTIAPQLQVPIINAGEGISGHPTQALLDVYTMLKTLGTLESKRVLIVGDVKHSRVARSNRDLLEKWGAEVAVCCPEYFAPADFKKVFTNLDEALQWAEVAMSLRIQWERHGAESQQHKQEYIAQYSINRQRLQQAKKLKMLMHPGPINWGVELQQDVTSDERCKILQQVENGVFVRAALMAGILGSEVL